MQADGLQERGVPEVQAEEGQHEEGAEEEGSSLEGEERCSSVPPLTADLLWFRFVLEVKA